VRSVTAPGRPYNERGEFDIHGAHGRKLYLHTGRGLDVLHALRRAHGTQRQPRRRVRVGQLIGTMIDFHTFGNRDHVHIGVCRGTGTACARDSYTRYRANIPIIQRISHARRVGLRR
jgi:hypothetical protein